MIRRRVLAASATVAESACTWMLVLRCVPRWAIGARLWLGSRLASTYTQGDIVQHQGKEWTISAIVGESLFMERPGGEWTGASAVGMKRAADG
jgi:hypothetical protein